MIYTNQVRNAVHRLSVPHGFILDTFEFNGFLLLRFYSDQWFAYSETQKADCGEYLQKVKDVLSLFGIQASLDPVIGKPGNENKHIKI